MLGWWPTGWWRPLLKIELILGSGVATSCFPVGPQPGCGYVLFVARRTNVRALIVVQALVKLEMYKLCKLGGAEVTGIRFLARVEPQVGFQVRSGGEPLVANITFVWFLTCVNQVVLLKVGKLGEAFGADVALKWALP